EAAKIVLEEYKPSMKPNAKTVTWEQVLAELPTSDTGKDLDARSLEMYAETVANLKKYVETKGPGDITEEKARQFRANFEKPYKKSQKDGAREYTRSPNTVYNNLLRLSCLWNHLRKMKYANSNPFEDCPRPSAKARKSKKRTIPTEEDFGQFIG